MAASMADFDAADLVKVPLTAWQQFRKLPPWQQALIGGFSVFTGASLLNAADEGFSKGKLRDYAKRAERRGRKPALEPELEQVRDFALVGALRSDCVANSSAPGCSSVRAAAKRLLRTEEWGLGDSVRAEVQRAKALREQRMSAERVRADTLGGVDRQGRVHSVPSNPNELGDASNGFHTDHGRRIARSDRQIRDIAIGRAKRFEKARLEMAAEGTERRPRFMRFYKD